MTRHTLFDDLDVSRETFDHLLRYQALLEKWNKAINLVAPSTISSVWKRHILDSAQLFMLSDPAATDWCDFGSGAGFPGLVIAILAREHRPDLTVTLIESDRRKATFLREVIRETGCAATVSTARAEAYEGRASILSARGFANLSATLDMALPVLTPDGVALLHKGVKHEQELTQAREIWHMESVKHISQIDPDSVILELSNIRRKQDTP